MCRADFSLYKVSYLMASVAQLTGCVKWESSNWHIHFISVIQIRIIIDFSRSLG